MAIPEKSLSGSKETLRCALLPVSLIITMIPVERHHRLTTLSTAAPESGRDLQRPLCQQEQIRCCFKPLRFGAIMAAKTTYSDGYKPQQ